MISMAIGNRRFSGKQLLFSHAKLVALGVPTVTIVQELKS
jgi:hypothetical protein